MAIEKFCHQCRQKRICYGSCVVNKGSRGCQVKYCEICLLRYRKNKDEVDLDTNWTCFKCLGICNCSVCRRAQGLQPTYRLINIRHVDEGSSGENLAENALAQEAKTAAKGKAIAGTSKSTRAAHVVEAKLPEGSSSITFSGIDLPSEDVGAVLQFMEFCCAFEKTLNLKTGQSESVIREIYSGRSSRRSLNSTLTQTIIQLLSVILEDRNQSMDCLTTTDDSWFTVLGECLENSEVNLDCFPPEMFQKGVAEYENLDSSKRLMLLNFLCDQTLDTSLIRKFIDEQSIEKERELDENIYSAKDKEERLKQQLQDELSRAEMEKGLPLSIEERLAIVKLREPESTEAHLELRNAIDMKKGYKIDEAVRNNPIGTDSNDRIFRKLKCYNDEQDILLQDLENSSEDCFHEKWLSFSSKQKLEVEMYISSKKDGMASNKNAKSNPESP